MTMTSPLGPARGATLNTAASNCRLEEYEKYEVKAFTVQSSSPQAEESQSSSSFVSCANESKGESNEEGERGDSASPAKSRHSRIISGTELSPLKILGRKKRTSEENLLGSMLAPAFRSPRKVSPETRFPVKIGDLSGATPPPPPPQQKQGTNERMIGLAEVMGENEGLRRAIEIFEDEASALGQDECGGEKEADKEQEGAERGAHDETTDADDTIMSTFSTFSAVPNLTTLAETRQSSAKRLAALSGGGDGGWTPRRVPRSSPDQDSGNNNTSTTLLMDFTEQMRLPQGGCSPQRRGNVLVSQTTPNVGATPRRSFANLIDFDMPPMPTPRSIPSITARELESLKSNFLSEISSLKASLSGREAEVESLKRAVGDAEQRVGASMEKLREERDAKEQLAHEKEDWERRGHEMERVLRTVREEMMHGQREREDLEQKLEESEKRREAAEMMHQEAESKMASMRTGREGDKAASPGKAKGGAATAAAREVEVAVERVARELHALYKSKHETKVAALKKSYESRWEKKVRELEDRVGELGEENARLKLARDPGPAHNSSSTTTNKNNSATEEVERQESKARAVRDSAAIKELQADVERLEAVVATVQRDNAGLRGMLERERVEKGELVQLAEELMSMQSFVGPSSTTPSLAAQEQHQHQQQERQGHPELRQQQQQQENQKPDGTKTPRPRPADNFRSSIGRASGLRAPQERRGLPRPGSVARSGIMSSIEKMGSHRGRTAE